MTKGETIAMAIEKECSRSSLVRWCKEWGFTVLEFETFLSNGAHTYDSAVLMEDDLK